jgi:hypothetical protein
MLVFAIDHYSTIEPSDLLVRLGYIPLAGMLGMDRFGWNAER